MGRSSRWASRIELLQLALVRGAITGSESEIEMIRHEIESLRERESALASQLDAEGTP